MRSDRVYQLRRAILEACRDYAPAPVSFDDLFSYPDFSLLKPQRQELLDEWNGLVTSGYLEFIPGSNREYLRITPKGLMQINREGDLEVYIWGKYGLG